MKPKGRVNVLYAAILLAFGAGTLINAPADAFSPNPPNLTLKRAFEIRTSVTTTQTYTDNVQLSETNRSADTYLSLVPSLQIKADTARLNGTFELIRREVKYSERTDRDTHANEFQTRLVLGAKDDPLRMDFNARQSRQVSNPFGVQTTGISNTNQTDTLFLQFSPYLVGRIGGEVQYEIRHRTTDTDVKDTAISDQTRKENSVYLRNTTPVYGLDWSMLVKASEIAFGAGNFVRESDVSRLELSKTFNRELTLRVAAGVDRNNFNTGVMQRYDTTSFGMDWNLSDQTRFSASKSKEFFGNGHVFMAEHRGPLSVWRYSDTQYASTQQDNLPGTVSTLSTDLYTTFAALEPDPVRREQMVAEYLRNSGLPPGFDISTAALAAALTQQRRQQATLTLLGSRNTLVLGAQQLRLQRLGASTGLTDLFSTTPVVNQDSGFANWSHRLSPNTSMTLGWTRTKSFGDTAALSSSLNVYNLIMSNRIGPHTTGSLMARRAEFESPTTPYKENSVVGTLNLQY